MFGLGFNVHRQAPVGASLLAIAVAQFASMLDVPPSSRAGSLPQGGVAVQSTKVQAMTTASSRPPTAG
ncbi:hypothetical protein F7R20_10995 [Pseudomonas brassicacearum subsp. brassicacearum]|nr:hypothetical protein F7R20_10995 [Pseudomonas brassicacearum subsp. brassicacearum]PJH87859.1 hypothetical protein CVG87_15850 [Pseudomonas sp. WCS365]QEO80908.1 hypothetical protein ELZ14_26415 [Pseudomonas brassicacearum]